jgi:hypothetical protein
MDLIFESVKIDQDLSTACQSSFCYQVINPFAVKFLSQQITFRGRVLQYIHCKQITVSYCFRVTLHAFASRCVFLFIFSHVEEMCRLILKFHSHVIRVVKRNQLYRKHNYICISRCVRKQVVKSVAKRCKNQELLSCVTGKLGESL